MKASELRIGNWMHFDNLLDWAYDYQINPRFFCNSYPPDDVDYELNNYHKPIQLTEEWLVKLGFVADGNNFVLYLSDYSDLTFSGGKMYLTSGQFSEMTETVPRDYVHQLQNIYLALTGTELTIK